MTKTPQAILAFQRDQVLEDDSRQEIDLMARKPCGFRTIGGRSVREAEVQQLTRSCFLGFPAQDAFVEHFDAVSLVAPAQTLAIREKFQAFRFMVPPSLLLAVALDHLKMV